jgi:AraC-like DNA-binding protein
MSERARGVSVKVFDQRNNLINQFPNMKSAAKHFGVDRSTISRIFRTGISYDDYIYKFEAKDIRI